MASATTREILDHLNDEQLEAVTAKEHPLIVIAGAGSGKTRVLTRRIAYRIATGTAEARHTLAVTFTKKASIELQQRLHAMKLREQIEAHTFHSAALRILQRYWDSQNIAPHELIESKHRLVAEALSSRQSRMETRGRSRTHRKEPSADQEPGKRSLVPAITSEIEWAKARGLTPQSYPETAVGEGRRTPLTPTEMGQVFLRYEQLKSRYRKLDYDDLIIGAARVLGSDQTFAATERYRMRHLYVDEFQDINPAQMNLVNALLGERSDLCVVGDPNQAIYSWNGADPTLITSLPGRFDSARTVVLSQNYRSTPQILALAHGISKMGKPLLQNSSPLVPNVPDGPIPIIRSFSTDAAEAQSVVRLAKQSRQPGNVWNSIAVLARTNSQLIPIQKRFKSMGVPASLAGETTYLAQNEIRALLVNLERGTVLLRGIALFAWLEGTVEARLQEYREASTSADNLSLFIELAREYLLRNPDSDGRALATWLKAEAHDSREQNDADAVTLTTFHRAKGLEWQTVFIVGMEEGLVPIARADSSKDALLEEMRLLYVAVTRAKKELTFTWARQRAFGDRNLAREPSRYLTELQTRINEASGRIASSEHALGEIRKARRKLESPESQAELTQEQRSILFSLRVWRSNKAKELGVPPHVILHDSALETLARRRPKTVEALASIAGIGGTKSNKFGTELLHFVNTGPRVE